MSSFPAADYLRDSNRTVEEMKVAMESILATTKQMFSGENGNVNHKTVSSGNVTPTSAITPVISAGGDVDLDYLLPTAMHDGAVVMLVAGNASNVVTVKDRQGGANEIRLNVAGPGYTAGSTDFPLTPGSRLLFLRYDVSRSAWIEIWRETGVFPGKKIYLTSGTFVVPSSVTQLNVTLIGGGGGGAGSYGANAGTAGGAGGAGGTTVFNSLSVAGGGGGRANSYSASPGSPGRPAVVVVGSQLGVSGMVSIPASAYIGEGGAGGVGLLARGGGGRGANGADASNSASAGGSSGVLSYVEDHVVTPGASLTVTIGAAGTAGAAGTGTPSGNVGVVGVAGMVLVEW